MSVNKVCIKTTSETSFTGSKSNYNASFGKIQFYSTAGMKMTKAHAFDFYHW